METTITHASLSASHTRTESKASTFWETMEFNRFGITMMLLMATLIPSGFAGAFTLNMGTIPFAIILGFAMFNLILTIGLAPMKVIVTMAVLNLLTAIIIISIGLAQSGGLLENYVR